MNNNKSTNQQINKSTNQQINEYLLLKNTLSISSISINNTNTTKNKILLTLILLLTLIISSLLLSTKTNAATPADACFTMGGPGGTTIIKYEQPGGANNCPTDVDIPATIGGVAPTAIGNLAFNGSTWPDNHRLTAVTMPDTIITIDDRSFLRNNITSVTLSNNLISLGASSFQRNKLTNINLPNTITTIGLAAFTDNRLSGNLQLPNSLISMGKAAFRYNHISGSLTIPNTVTDLGDEVFSHNDITSVTLGDSVTSINPGAFSLNDIKEITITNKITSIANNAFTLQTSSKTARDHMNTHDNNMVLLPYDMTVDDYKTLYYTKVYISSKDNPNNLKDGSSWGLETVYSPNKQIDMNGDGDSTDYLSFGGHIINPAPVDINYVDQDTNSDIKSSDSYTGKFVPTRKFTSTYMVSDDPTDYPAPANNVSYTPAERDSILATFDETYFSLGDSPSFDAPIIDGYVLVSPSSPHVFNLASLTNNFKFLYKKVDSLASTGSNIPLIITSTILLIMISGTIGLKIYQRKNR